MDTYTLDLQEIVDKGMIPVIRKRDILKIKVLTREEKKRLARGSADILGISPSGQTVMLHRKTIIEEYTYLNGGKINMAGLKSNKEYMIMREDNTPAFAMLVPLNCKADVNGKMANDKKRKVGDYIVTLQGPNGLPDQNTVGVIPSALFKKLYHIPQNEVIARNKYGGSKLFGTTKHDKNLDKKAHKAPDFTSKLGLNPEEFDFGADEMYKQKAKPVNTPGMNIKLRKDEEVSSYRYIASGRLMDASNNLVGFVIQDKNGRAKNITIQQMMQLCSKKLVSNIKISTKSDTGKAYLSGNNIKISMLPEYKI